MHVGLGQSVFSRDGQKIGTIDRVVLHAGDHHVEQFVVHQGIFLDQDKVVPREAVERVDRDGVHLTLDAAEAKQLARFEHSYAAGDFESGYPEVIPGPYQSIILFSTPPSGKTYLDHGHLFSLDPLATPDAPPAPVTEEGIIIGKGAEVVGSDGVKIGNVHEVDYADDGSLARVVVQLGLIRHHRVTVPAGEIAEIGDDEIVLAIPAAVAFARSA